MDYLEPHGSHSTSQEGGKVVVKPIETQLLKYLFLRGAYATHGKYWEELNVWLSDKNMDELEMANLYQELVLRKHEVDLELKFKRPSPTNNNLAIQLHAKINNRHNSKSAGMMAIPCSNEVNIAHVANYGDLCRHVLCRKNGIRQNICGANAAAILTANI